MGRYDADHSVDTFNRETVMYPSPFEDATTLEEEKAGNGLHRLTRPTGSRPDPGPDMPQDK
jgi:hypothetical protein